VLRRIWKTSGGNPFLALELGQALQPSGGLVHSVVDFRIPASLDAPVRERIDGVSAAALRVGRVVAALSDPVVEVVERALGLMSTLAILGRCRALVLAARGDVARAGKSFEEALVQHDRFQRARTLLAQEVTQRRALQRRAARQTSEQRWSSPRGSAGRGGRSRAGTSWRSSGNEFLPNELAITAAGFSGRSPGWRCSVGPAVGAMVTLGSVFRARCSVLRARFSVLGTAGYGSGTRPTLLAPRRVRGGDCRRSGRS